jgi:hypothetical protein
MIKWRMRGFRLAAIRKLPQWRLRFLMPKVV